MKIAKNGHSIVTFSSDDMVDIVEHLLSLLYYLVCSLDSITMTRSIRDLREIINVSRLSIHGNYSDEYSSGDSDKTLEDDFDDLSDYICNRPSSAMAKSSFQTPFIARPATAMGARETSAIVYNYRPRTAPVNGQQDADNHIFQEHNFERNAVPVENNISIIKSFPNKYTPVPPIGQSNELRHSLNKHILSPKSIITEDSTVSIGTIRPNNDLSLIYDEQVACVDNYEEKDDVNIDQGISMSNGEQLVSKKSKNFDKLFQYLDGTIIASWLEKCNNLLNHFDQFMKLDHNFVNFANFFLTQLPLPQYTELLDLEFSIILDHFKYAFHSGFSNGYIKNSELYMLAKSVMKEYPSKLKRKKRGPKLLLDIIIILCSGKTNVYRTLLKDINCHSYNKQNVQWLLAIRAFGLISFISGILKFYENVANLKELFTNEKSSDENNLQLNIDNLIIQAVRYDYLYVLDYFYTNHKADFNLVLDEKKRNIVSIAVNYSNLEILHYILKVTIMFLLFHLSTINLLKLMFL